MYSFSFKSASIALCVFISIFVLSGCEEVKSSQSTKQVLTPYDELKPKMPFIPKDIEKNARKTDLGKSPVGILITEREVRYCGLNSKDIYIVSWSFRDRSNNPVVIQDDLGNRRLAPKKCTYQVIGGSFSNMNIGEISIPVTRSTNLVSLTTLGLNPKLRKILITSKSGGQWNESQMQKLRTQFIDPNTGQDK